MAAVPSFMKSPAILYAVGAVVLGAVAYKFLKPSGGGRSRNSDSGDGGSSLAAQQAAMIAAQQQQALMAQYGATPYAAGTINPATGLPYTTATGLPTYAPTYAQPTQPTLPPIAPHSGYQWTLQAGPSGSLWVQTPIPTPVGSRWQQQGSEFVLLSNPTNQSYVDPRPARPSLIQPVTIPTPP